MLLFAVVFGLEKGNSTRCFWSQKQLIPRDIAERGQDEARCKSEHFTASRYPLDSAGRGGAEAEKPKSRCFAPANAQEVAIWEA
jgi:hypothetical protein